MKRTRPACTERAEGLATAAGVSNRIEIQMGTLGKALGAAGGYICGSSILIDYLINRARTFIFSTAPVGRRRRGFGRPSPRRIAGRCRAAKIALAARRSIVERDNFLAIAHQTGGPRSIAGAWFPRTRRPEALHGLDGQPGTPQSDHPYIDRRRISGRGHGGRFAGRRLVCPGYSLSDRRARHSPVCG